MRAEFAMIKDFNDHQDKNTASVFLLLSIKRAFGLWLDILCVLYITIVTLSLVQLGKDGVPGGNVGLAISQLMGLISMCQWGMRQSAELENQMISVERVLEYTDLPAESKDIETKVVTPENWPADGNIEFKDFELKYSDKGEAVLKDLNFSIKSNEKIGVVGRTAAGKSSLVQALFQLAPSTGSIQIDGISSKTCNSMS